MLEIKNLKKAAKRIAKAAKNKEKIILYGDADLDGISSVILLKEAIKNMGGDVGAVYFPDREIEGYGLNQDALAYLKDRAPALLIVLDCGIGNFAEVKLAKKLGFEVIIVDHHQPLRKLPQAFCIVNPKQKGDKYPFKNFAAAGVVFKLAEALLKRKLTGSLRDDFLELAALATMADMMPQSDDNIELLEKGFKSLKTTVRPGLKVFWQIDSIAQGNIKQIAQKIISACYAAGNQDHVNEGYLLLTSKSIAQAKVLAQDLIEKSHVRQARIRDMVDEIEGKISSKRELIIFEGDNTWPVLMLGPAASKLCHAYQKPVFLYSQKQGYCQGAVRTPTGLDSVKAMIQCSKTLETYGGHPQAGGFRIQAKNLEMFKNCLIKYFKKP